MNLIDLYHHLPIPLRSVAATMWGYRLSSWRYGPQTDDLVSEALEREHWTSSRWKSWQENRLAEVLDRAARKVPYYRDYWTDRRRRGDTASWELLENWPILEKECVRQHPEAFLADDCNRTKMYHEHTSGTTGKSLDLWWSRETVRQWYALFEARWRRWYGFSRGDRWALLGGQLIAPARQTEPPFWVWNASGKQLYMSSYHLAPRLIPHYLDALARYQIVYVMGYTSALHALAEQTLRLKRKDVKLAAAITTAEPVFDYQRRAIEQAFQCPLRETYGQAEIVAAASECASGKLHLWPEAGWLEVRESDAPTPRGQTGDLICTGLLNADMPLIRYRLGDRGALSADQRRCPCGRALPRLASLDGRADEVLYASDGRVIGRLDPVFKARLPILEAQIVQETLNRVRVRYVPAADFSSAAGRSIVERLQARMGSIDVILEPVDMVPRTSNGKFRAVISELSAEDRARVAG